MSDFGFETTYRGKTVIVTGDTGFKGSWLATWLLELGADVHGIARDIPTQPSHFESAGLVNRVAHHMLDIRETARLTDTIRSIEPDFVFHLAAQALVRKSYRDPLETLSTNVMGTANVLEALRETGESGGKPCVGVIITSDKCYDNVESIWGYREDDRLGGKDPYSASKGAAELAIRTYARSFFDDAGSPVKIASSRAGNVIGGGDWAPDRIVPDCMRAWSRGREVEIRNPGATRPWEHVLEPLSGYLALGARLANDSDLNGESFNFGPPANQDYTVEELIVEMSQYWDSVRWRSTAEDQPFHEAGLLKLCCDKALAMLQWQPALTFEDTVRLTIEWYRNYYSDDREDVHTVTRRQIIEYVDQARERGIAWAI